MSPGEQAEVYLWALLAFSLGALVGLEREFRGHEAGIRTCALVCGGSATFALVGNQLGEDRIAAAIVQGVGFLGAGLVFQRGHNVRGVTTAATIWVLAAVGIVVAQEMWVTALLVIATVVVLLELAPVSDWVLRSSIRRGTVHKGGVLPEDEHPAAQNDIG